MAIAKTEEDEKKQEQGMNVLGQAGQGMQMQADQSKEVQEKTQAGGGTSAFIGQGGGTPQQPQTAQAGAAGAANKAQGSGMFTDLRKYVEANKPQAQAMSGAVQGGLQRQAGRIQQGVEEQQKTFQQQVAENRARREQAQQFAQQQLETAGTQGMPSEEDIQRFQALTSGQEGFANVGNIAINQQDQQARELARKAAIANKAQGASQLLQETFGAKDRYTGGQRSLDALILGGDTSARDALVQGAQQAAETATGGVRGARNLARAETAALRDEQSQFQEGLQEQLGGAREQVLTDIDAEVERQRQALIDKKQAFRRGLEEGTLTEEQLREYISPEMLQSELEAQRNRLGYAKGALAAYLGDEAAARAAQGDYGDVGELRDVDYWINRRYGQEYRADKLFGGGVGYAGEGSGFAQPARELLQRYGYDQAELANYQEQYKQDFMAKEQAKRDAEIQAVKDEYAQRYAHADPVYGERYAQQEIQRLGLDKPIQVDDAQVYARSVQDLIQDLNVNEENVYGDLMSAIQSGRGKDFLNLIGNELNADVITRQTAVTDDQIARQQALAALAGRQGEGILERQERETTPGQFDFAKALQKYRTL